MGQRETSMHEVGPGTARTVIDFPQSRAAVVNTVVQSEHDLMFFIIKVAAFLFTCVIVVLYLMTWQKDTLFNPNI